MGAPAGPIQEGVEISASGGGTRIELEERGEPAPESVRLVILEVDHITIEEVDFE